jgi:GGDEF domain-containing protein
LLSDRPGLNLGSIDYETAAMDEVRQARSLNTEVVLVDARDHDYALEAVSMLRRHGSVDVYTLPVVLVGEEETMGRRLPNAADRVVSRDELDDYGVQKLKDAFAPWLKRLKRLKEASAVRSTLNDREDSVVDADPGVRILRYLYVRRQEIVPVRGVWSIHGYHFPQLAMFLESEDVSLLKIMEYLESQALIQGRLHDRAFACARCGCHFLNFREVCPHGRSANLESDDLVHHFHCGYVAPEPEFHEGARMVCPKCSKQLKRLGADYDKPSLVYTCKDCGHTFQEPDVSVVCYNCGYTAEPEEHVHRTIKRYELTSLGENAAINGMTSLFKEVLTERMQVVEMDTFKVFLEVERHRIQRYGKSDSSLIYFSILNLGGMHQELGDQARTVFSQLSDIVASALRDSDVVSPLNDSTYLALLVETPLKGARTAAERLEENITELVQENVTREASVKTHAFALQPDVEAKDLLQQVLDHINAE